jgi:hypothetical protein
MSFQSQVLGMGYLVLGRGTEVLNTLRLHYISRHASLLALPLPPALVRKRRRVPLPLLDVEREQQGQGQEHRDEEEDEGGAEGAGPLVAEGDEGPRKALPLLVMLKREKKRVSCRLGMSWE